MKSGSIEERIRYSPVWIITKLREAEVILSQGKTERQPGMTQRYNKRPTDEEDFLNPRIIWLLVRVGVP